MEDGKPDKSDTNGEELNNDSTEAEKVRKDTEELKAENDAYDKQKLRAETIRAEKARGGKSEAGQQEEKPKELTDTEYVKKVMAGEVGDEKE